MTWQTNRKKYNIQNHTNSAREIWGQKAIERNQDCAYRVQAGLLCGAAASLDVSFWCHVFWLLDLFLIWSGHITASGWNCSLHPIVTALCVIPLHLISPISCCVFSACFTSQPHLTSPQLPSSHLMSSLLFSALLRWSQLLSSLLIIAAFLGSPQLI